MPCSSHCFHNLCWLLSYWHVSRRSIDRHTSRQNVSLCINRHNGDLCVSRHFSKPTQKRRSQKCWLRQSLLYLDKSTKTIYLAHRRNSHLLNFAYQRKNNPKFIRIPWRETRLFGSVVLNTTTAKGKAAEWKATEWTFYCKRALVWNALDIGIRNIRII